MTVSIPTIGQVLGHYRIVERIGAGASGRRSQDRPIAPAELTYRAAVRCIQSKPRIPMLEHQVATVGFHVR